MKKLFKLIVGHPVIVFVLALGITALAVASMASSFRMETNLDKYMPATHHGMPHYELEQLFH